MKKSAKKCFLLAGACLFLFLLLTFLVMKVDVQPIGPQNSTVGLATINGTIFEACGSNPLWYTISEALGIVALLCIAGFGCLGAWQLISGKSLKKVDKSLFVLAGFYAVVAFVYVLFEVIVINYRPILEEGILEASYPSSHTILVCCIMLTTALQLQIRIRNNGLRLGLQGACLLITVLTAIGRILAGVHWYTDVVAALLISGVLVFAYLGVIRQLKIRK
ncbi:MAG: phosphatase PAP2 family protein [Clostridia bacterium]|nr:phosphatase PAP2 family protein [Clostridia bacterium]